MCRSTVVHNRLLMIHASLAIAVAVRCAATANLINVMKTASATAYKAYMYIQS